MVASMCGSFPGGNASRGFTGFIKKRLTAAQVARLCSHPFITVHRLNILQIFSRYLQYGGEEGSVYRIGDELQTLHNVEYFIASSEEMMEASRVLLPVLVYYNFPVLKRLENYQRIGRFDLWQIHNVFPAVSPGAYTLARKLGVPIIHYLHNYRMGCVNGFWFTQGGDCQKCSSGNFVPGVLGKCWRDSWIQSAIMARTVRPGAALGGHQPCPEGRACPHGPAGGADRRGASLFRVR